MPKMKTTDPFSYHSRGEVVNSTNNLVSILNRSYSYDPIGNRLNATEGEENNPATNPSAKTYATNSLNQYTQINTTSPTPPSTAQPTYDADGNMLTDGTGKTYTWDCENRLIQVTLSDNGIVKYHYDADFRRIKREHLTSANTAVTTYLYEGWNVINEKTVVFATSLESTTATIQIYHWGLDLSNNFQEAGGIGGLLCNKISTGNILTLYHYTYDANGNVSELLAPAASLEAHYKYDPFGNTIFFAGSYAQHNIYRFSTKPFETTGLYYYGYRFYQSSVGRWINYDFIAEKSFLIQFHEEVKGEILNMYRFVNNDAVQKSDILGLKGSPVVKPYASCKLISHSILALGNLRRVRRGIIFTRKEYYTIRRRCRYRCYHPDATNYYEVPCKDIVKCSLVKDHGVDVLVTVSSSGRSKMVMGCNGMLARVTNKEIVSGFRVEDDPKYP